MSVKLNHTIVWASDKQRSAQFLSDMFALPEPVAFGRFLVVPTANGVSMDFAERETSAPVSRQHYAFQVSDEEFDAVMDRIEQRGLDYWADPARTIKGRINHNDGGKGVYFHDPDGHVLEALTVPYGGTNP